jgi:hypothetical protein
MIDYNKWPRRKLSASNIKLDINNPRLPKELFGKATQREIINYLFEKEKLIVIIKSVVKNGYWPNEMPYVTKEKNRFVVLEGNRRTAACKVILDPALAPKAKQKQIIKIIKDFDLNIVKKIDVIISPIRDDVDIIIEARHTALQIEKWGPIKKARFYFYKLTQGESISDLEKKFQTKDIKKHIKQYLLFEEVNSLDFSTAELEMLTDESNLNLSTLVRIVNFKSGQAFLGISFNQDGTFNRHIPEDEYKRRFSFFVKEILNKNIDSRSANKDEDLVKFIEQAFLQDDINSDVIPNPEEINEAINKIESVDNSTKPLDSNTGKTTKGKTSKPKISNSLIPKQFLCDTGISRIDDIVIELQNLNLNKNPNAIAVLFRSFLDMITYRFILSNNHLSDLIKAKSIEDMKKHKLTGKKILKELASLKYEIKLDPNKEFPKSLNGGISRDWLPSLMLMLSFIVDNNLIPDVKLHQALKQYIRRGNKFLNHHDFNLFVHNEYVIPQKDELTELWKNLSGVIQVFVDDLNKQQSQKQKTQLSLNL